MDSAPFPRHVFGARHAICLWPGQGFAGRADDLGRWSTIDLDGELRTSLGGVEDGFHGIYPLVMTNIAIENCHRKLIEIVDLPPINSMVIFHSLLYVYQRVILSNHLTWEYIFRFSIIFGL